MARTWSLCARNPTSSRNENTSIASHLCTVYLLLVSALQPSIDYTFSIFCNVCINSHLFLFFFVSENLVPNFTVELYFLLQLLSSRITLDCDKPMDLTKGKN